MNVGQLKEMLEGVPDNVIPLVFDPDEGDNGEYMPVTGCVTSKHTVTFYSDDIS